MALDALSRGDQYGGMAIPTRAVRFAVAAAVSFGMAVASILMAVTPAEAVVTQKQGMKIKPPAKGVTQACIAVKAANDSWIVGPGLYPIGQWTDVTDKPFVAGQELRVIVYDQYTEKANNLTCTGGHPHTTQVPWDDNDYYWLDASNW
jgi:hypothetical protein